MDVLIVTDDRHERETIRRGLQHAGYTVAPASFDDACARLGAPAGPGSLVCDAETLTAARAARLCALRAARPTVRVVVLAGLKTPPALATLLDDGVVVLRRPFGPDDLASAAGPGAAG